MFGENEVRSVARLVRKLIAADTPCPTAKRKLIEHELARMDASNPRAADVVSAVSQELDRDATGPIDLKALGLWPEEGEGARVPGKARARQAAPRPTHPASPGVAMTARPRQVLVLLLQGQSESQIAKSLSISPHTVHDHVKVVYRKLGVSSRRELMAQLLRLNGHGSKPTDR